MSDLLAHLNPPQLQAVTLPPVHALILAGAGSGKTRVLTTRIAWLLSTNQMSPHAVLAVTFTNKAAKEMSARLAATVPFNIRSMWIGTFHGLCNRMLRAHFREAGLPQTFQILDSGDQLAMVKRLLKNLNVDDEKYPPRELCHFFNAHKEQGVRAAQAEAYDSYTQKRVELYAEYEAQCNREGVCDFAELLLRCYELLSRNEPLRQHYQARFRTILVDEFQDTNRLQYAWLQLLAGGGASIFAVGDDDQSIYRFRGAEVGNMREFERNYAGANVIRLEQNYRSHGNILAAANALIKNNSDRLGKNLWTDAGDGEPIRVYDGYSDLDEARFVVDEVRELIRDGVSPLQIALLYRSNAQSRVLEHELFTRAVPYKVYGGLRFFERQEIKHALAYLRLLGNPDDDTAFLRVVNFPTRGIGARSLESLQGLAHQFNSSLYNAAASLSGKAGQAVGAFIRLIEGLRQECEKLPLPEIIEHVLDRSGLKQHYQSEKDGQERLENLDELINAAATFIDDDGVVMSVEGEGGALASFLAHASLEAGEHQAGEGQEAVQLMTVHAAKGLEFDAVFITGLEQGLFPHENAVSEGEAGLQEERRLMYVAVTRARKRLYLCHAQSRMLHGQTRYCTVSSFLEEIPQELLRHLGQRPTGRAVPGGGWSAGSSARSTAGSTENALPNGLRIGQSVEHAKFGAGVIVASEGRGADARVQVNFGGATGMKWLALEYAKLTPI
ncbi:UvrD-helicase domain-containing protein [Dechloromonas sp. ZY10]|uniref:UvrD-helicase domain-containing protein n=1 Tax=Dechloromonas aquae TaxID=2664436 RepID=UPI0035283836